MKADLEHLHRVHCIGIGGIGVSAVAKFLRLQGKEVAGSDVARSIVTEDAERAGVTVLDPSAENISPDLDLIIYTSAAPEEQVERQAAAQLGIPQLSYFEFLGLISKGRKTVAVCGTNGKSTTTAMLALMLEAAGLDPLVIVGSRVPSFEYGNLRMGKSDIFVVEACEYREQFLSIEPAMVVTTKIVEDHLDYYRDLAHIESAFRVFAAKLPTDGPLFWNLDDAGSRETYADRPRAGGTFGFAPEADLRAEGYEASAGLQRFDAVFEDGTAWRGMELRVPGAFNVSNALAAIAAARALGADEASVRRALGDFRGIWRRFERVGDYKGAPVISDYGHTPDAIEATLAGAKAFFPGRRLVVAFQPHHHERTRTLYDAFVRSFDAADVLILNEIYGVEGRKQGAGEVSSRDLVRSVIERDRLEGRSRPVDYAEHHEEALALIKQTAQPDDLVIVMGAGSIDSVARTLCQLKR